MMQLVRKRLQGEAVFLVSLFLAILSSFQAPPSWKSIDWHVIGSLLALMAAVLGLENARLFDRVAVRLVGRFGTQRSVTLAMVLLTGLLSTVVTNDVALLSLVPLMLAIAGRAGFNPLWPVVLQTLAANIGSALTPMGNPQNLYLFSHYRLSPMALSGAAMPFVATGMLAVMGLTLLLLPAAPISFTLPETENDVCLSSWRVPVYAGLFLAGVAGVFHWLPIWGVVAASLLALFLFDRPLLRKLDIFLLLTFVCFFVAIGNLTHLSAVTVLADSLVASARGAYVAGLVLSQGISNVPAALLIAPFTPHWKSVLLGVNIGGMGTLIASMASLISYRLYIRQHNGSLFLTKFHLVNLLLLVLFGAAFLAFAS